MTFSAVLSLLQMASEMVEKALSSGYDNIISETVFKLNWSYKSWSLLLFFITDLSSVRNEPQDCQ